VAPTANRKKRGRDGGRPVAHDAEQYKERDTVERCINKIRAWRGQATRYDKAPASYVAGSSYADPSSGCAASTWARGRGVRLASRPPRPRTSDL